MTKKNTKRTLLTNVIALVLCISMFVGSTFAWFTDSASTNVNTIEAGTLDVELVDQSGTSLEGKTLSFVKENGTDKIEDANVIWEPGVRHQLQAVAVKNNGSLALKYKMLINYASDTKGLAEVIEVHVGGTNLGTLSEISKSEKAIKTGVVEAKKVEEASTTIKLVMKTSAGNQYQGAKLSGLSIMVVAGQAQVESDSIDNTYDASAAYWGESDPNGWDGNAGTLPAAEENVYTITTAAELKAFANAVNNDKNTFAGKTVVLANDIDLNWKEWTPIGQTGATEFKGVFDGQGHTIYNLKVNSAAKTGAHYSSGLFGWFESHGTENITVKNLTIDGANVVGHHYVAVVVGYTEGSTTIENVHVKNAKINNTFANFDASGDKTGLITGYMTAEVTIKKCSGSNSTVLGTRDAGQLVGSGIGATLTNCKATDVSVKSNGGSLIDENGNKKAENIREELIGRI